MLLRDSQGKIKLIPLAALELKLLSVATHTLRIYDVSSGTASLRLDFGSKGCHLRLTGGSVL